jgi:hypothetical protein
MKTTDIQQAAMLKAGSEDLNNYYGSILGGAAAGGATFPLARTGLPPTSLTDAAHGLGDGILRSGKTALSPTRALGRYGGLLTSGIGGLGALLKKDEDEAQDAAILGTLGGAAAALSRGAPKRVPTQAVSGLLGRIADAAFRSPINTRAGRAGLALTAAPGMIYGARKLLDGFREEEDPDTFLERLQNLFQG